MKYYKNPQTRGFESNCDKTMIGWYIPNKILLRDNWSCFFGFKTKKLNPNVSLLQIENKFMKKTHKKNHKSISFYYSDDPIFIEKSSKFKTHLMKYEDQKDFVDDINKHDLSWKADFNANFKGMSFAELNNHIGSKSRYKRQLTSNFDENEDFPSQDQFLRQLKAQQINKLKKKHRLNSDNLRENDSKNVHNPKEITKYLNTDINEIDSNTLPKNWDWRNVGGENFVPPVRRQADCGSCYIFSTVGSLESRLRIMTNNQDTTLFSKQFPISCNFYTEGCEGGYPILVAKFFNEFEIIPEDCFQYQARDVSCSQRCSTLPSKKYTVSKYGYLGGFYGATNEELMMKEIRARGPIPGNIMVPWSFSYYKKGIFAHDHALVRNSGKISKKKSFEQETRLAKS